MDRTTRPLVIFAAFAGSLVVGLVIMLWALGGLRTVTAPAASPGGVRDRLGRGQPRRARAARRRGALVPLWDRGVL